MTAQEYIIESEKLFDSWKEAANANSFVIDGIVDPNTWFNSEQNHKILIILKEAYISDGKAYDWDLTKWLKNEICCSIENCPKNHNCDECKVTGSTYNRVAEWIYGLTKSNTYDSWLGLKDDKKTTKNYREKRKSQFKKAAIINIKKYDGLKTSKSSDLINIADTEHANLIKQILLINPDTIICGGTKSCLDKLCEKDITFAKHLSNTTVIDSPHPNAHQKAEKMFKTILSQIKSEVTIYV